MNKKMTKDEVKKETKRLFNIVKYQGSELGYSLKCGYLRDLLFSINELLTTDTAYPATSNKEIISAFDRIRYDIDRRHIGVGGIIKNEVEYTNSVQALKYLLHQALASVDNGERYYPNNDVLDDLVDEVIKKVAILNERLMTVDQFNRDISELKSKAFDRMKVENGESKEKELIEICNKKGYDLEITLHNSALNGKGYRVRIGILPPWPDKDMETIYIEECEDTKEQVILSALKSMQVKGDTT